MNSVYIAWSFVKHFKMQLSAIKIETESEAYNNIFEYNSYLHEFHAKFHQNHPKVLSLEQYNKPNKNSDLSEFHSGSIEYSCAPPNIPYYESLNYGYPAAINEDGHSSSFNVFYQPITSSQTKENAHNNFLEYRSLLSTDGNDPFPYYYYHQHNNCEYLNKEHFDNSSCGDPTSIDNQIVTPPWKYSNMVKFHNEKLDLPFKEREPPSYELSIEKKVCENENLDHDGNRLADGNVNSNENFLGRSNANLNQIDAPDNGEYVDPFEGDEGFYERYSPKGVFSEVSRKFILLDF